MTIPRPRRYAGLAALVFVGSSFAPIGCCCIIPIPAVVAADDAPARPPVKNPEVRAGVRSTDHG